MIRDEDMADDEPTITLCVLCREPVEDEDQPEGAEVCNECARYLDVRFGEVGNIIADIPPDALPDTDEQKA